MTATTDALADFLLARIAEDEGVARAAAGTAVFQGQAGRWVYEQVPHIPSGTTIPVIFAVADRGGKTQVANMETAWDRGERAEHITRNDPARVLAECEVKQAIVELYLAATGDVMETAPANSLSDPLAAYRRGALEMVRSLVEGVALLYADHPDYRDEWRP